MFVKNYKGCWSMIVRLAFVESLPGCLTTGRAACVHSCVWVHLALVTIPRWHHHLLPVEVLSGPARLLAHTRGSPRPACGQTAMWHDTKRPMVYARMLWPSLYDGPQTPSPSQSFSLCFDVHIGSINALKRASLWLSFRLFLSMPLGPVLCLGLRT